MSGAAATEQQAFSRPLCHQMASCEAKLPGQSWGSRSAARSPSAVSLPAGRTAVPLAAQQQPFQNGRRLNTRPSHGDAQPHAETFCSGPPRCPVPNRGEQQSRPVAPVLRSHAFPQLVREVVNATKTRPRLRPLSGSSLQTKLVWPEVAASTESITRIFARDYFIPRIWLKQKLCTLDKVFGEHGLIRCKI